jgi:hypothetical protein
VDGVISLPLETPATERQARAIGKAGRDGRDRDRFRLRWAVSGGGNTHHPANIVRTGGSGRFPGLRVPILWSRWATLAPAMVAFSMTSRQVTSGGRFCSPASERYVKPQPSAMATARCRAPRLEDTAEAQPSIPGPRISLARQPAAILVPTLRLRCRFPWGDTAHRA